MIHALHSARVNGCPKKGRPHSLHPCSPKPFMPKTCQGPSPSLEISVRGLFYHISCSRIFLTQNTHLPGTECFISPPSAEPTFQCGRSLITMASPGVQRLERGFSLLCPNQLRFWLLTSTCSVCFRQTQLFSAKQFLASSASQQLVFHHYRSTLRASAPQNTFQLAICHQPGAQSPTRKAGGIAVFPCAVPRYSD